jgi:hypothetical protein
MEGLIKKMERQHGKKIMVLDENGNPENVHHVIHPDDSHRGVG